MKDALILGGGFAGVWSAAGAVRLARTAGRDRLRVRLISASDDMVIRPRLYERNPDKMRIDLDRLLKPIGVERLNARVESIDTASQTVMARGADGALVTASYDRLVLATGSQLNRPAFRGAAHAFDIDTLDAAVALDAHLHHLPQLSTPARYTAVVVGAGFTGLEIATELVGRLGDVAAGQEVRGSWWSAPRCQVLSWDMRRARSSLRLLTRWVSSDALAAPSPKRPRHR